MTVTFRDFFNGFIMVIKIGKCFFVFMELTEGLGIFYGFDIIFNNFLFLKKGLLYYVKVVMFGLIIWYGRSGVNFI